MKKWFIIFGVVFLIVAFAAVGYAANPIKLIVNGQEIHPDVPPQLMNGRTMVPIRWVAEALGAEVQWDAKNRQVKVNVPPEVWQGDSGLTEREGIYIRNHITRFLIAYDQRDREEGIQLVSENFDTNLLGPEVVIPIGGVYPVMIDYKFIDAKKESDGKVRVRVEVYENSFEGLTVQNWDFIMNNQTRLIEGLFVDEKQTLDSYTVFQGMTINNN